jgi:hypothetical protein
VVTLIDNKKFLDDLPRYILSKKQIVKAFDNNILNFFIDVGNHLKKISFDKDTSGLAALNFWLRKQNIAQMKKTFENDNLLKAPLGIVFHITPSNTPLTFFYSYFFGVITGNINIVRLPKRNFIELNLLIKIILKLLSKKKYLSVKKRTFFLRYDKNTDYTKIFSSICDLRIIWGGEKSINDIRKFPIPTKSREITFSDKYSVSIINSNKLINLNVKELNRLVRDFYNDIFFMDQNACSSPHVIFWYGNKTDMARKKFWKVLENLTKNEYDLPKIGSMDKITNLFSDLNNLKIKNQVQIDKSCTNIYLKDIPKNLDNLRVGWGYIYELDIKNISSLNKIISNKFQTLTYYGFDKHKLASKIFLNNACGIDRIVRIGSANSMSQVWDGYDLLNCLTRVIDVK